MQNKVLEYEKMLDKVDTQIGLDKVEKHTEQDKKVQVQVQDKKVQVQQGAGVLDKVYSFFSEMKAWRIR